MATLKELGAELAEKIARGEYSALAPAKPRAAPAPQKPAMSENEKQVRAYWSKKLADCSALFRLCEQYGASPLVAAQFAERGLSLDAARAELEHEKAVASWQPHLRAAQGLY